MSSPRRELKPERAKQRRHAGFQSCAAAGRTTAMIELDRKVREHYANYINGVGVQPDLDTVVAEAVRAALNVIPPTNQQGEAEEEHNDNGNDNDNDENPSSSTPAAGTGNSTAVDMGAGIVLAASTKDAAQTGDNFEEFSTLLRG
ncbi:Uu.00g113890.m01.CDS01 [Anthostomella pinea]|uniref:Uu.00g113890.m01.CDS01 n=1 Tax=Anthostomella pinea TaxID=933095 RepID=A0AAI8VFK6_9PEZI|nr:Uu.00g113890.m01.CDS01 [Anthostomella pinea]